MRWIVYNRYNGSWVRCAHFTTYSSYQWYLNILKDIDHAFMVIDSDSGAIIHEWYPSGYDRNPTTNARELQIGSDTHKRRFPGGRRRETR